MNSVWQCDAQKYYTILCNFVDILNEIIGLYQVASEKLWQFTKHENTACITKTDYSQLVHEYHEPMTSTNFLLSFFIQLNPW